MLDEIALLRELAPAVIALHALCRFPLCRPILIARESRTGFPARPIPFRRPRFPSSRPFALVIPG